MDPSQNVTSLLSLASGLAASLASTRDDINQFYTQVNAVQVFMMQCGFAFLEAGCVETKNVTNILMKSFIDTIIGGIVWYLWGFGIGFGDMGNQFIGDRHFFRYIAFTMMEGSNIGAVRTNWFFQFTFACAGTTIVSGALAARCRFPAYSLWGLFCMGWVYPVVAHWMWSTTGWLSPFADATKRTLPIGAVDYAGSGVVHLLGGTCALFGAIIIGPRLGRFDPDWDGDKPGTLRTFRSLWSGLGTFLLWYGWYGFNPGSSLAATDKSDVNALACINTTIGACAGSLSAILIQYIAKGNWDLGKLCNGLLAGLAAITGGCVVVQPWAALIIGAVAGGVYTVATNSLTLLHVDDPVEATPVHLANGLWGLIATGFFADKGLMERTYGYTIEHYGAFMGGGGLLLGMQLLTIVVIFAWAAVWSVLFFLAINGVGYLRVTPDVEKMGLDLEHIEMTEQQKNLMYQGRYKYDKKSASSEASKKSHTHTNTATAQEMTVITN